MLVKSVCDFGFLNEKVSLKNQRISLYVSMLGRYKSKFRCAVVLFLLREQVFHKIHLMKGV